MSNSIRDSLIFVIIIVFFLAIQFIINNTISCSGNSCIEVEKVDITDRVEIERENEYRND